MPTCCAIRTAPSASNRLSACPDPTSYSSSPPRSNLSRWKTQVLALAKFGFALFIGCCALGAEDFSNQHARSSPGWLREGVVYEIFPRNFSAQGNFNGITARLDELKDLGVNILWLMPIHPVGEKMKKGSLGSPYAVRDFYAINPD